MASLESRAILLDKKTLPVIGDIFYYHRYTIYTKDNGEQITKITQNTIKIFFIHFLLANTTKLQKICH